MLRLLIKFKEKIKYKDKILQYFIIMCVLCTVCACCVFAYKMLVYTCPGILVGVRVCPGFWLPTLLEAGPHCCKLLCSQASWHVSFVDAVLSVSHPAMGIPGSQVIAVVLCFMEV